MHPLKSSSVVALLLLVSFAGCEEKKREPHRDVSTEESPASKKPSSAVPAQPEKPEPEPTEKVPTPEERKACLGPPLSPGVDELPEIEGLRHIAKEMEHVFLPERPEKGSDWSSSIEAEGKRLRDKFGPTAQFGTGLCGSESDLRKYECLRLTVPICEYWLDEVRRLARQAKESGMGIVVQIAGRLGPRCSQGDPDCGPLPYHHQLDDPNQDDRTWAGQFTLPLRPGVDTKTLREDLSSGTCTHAGDCVRAGCGNNCDAWHEPIYAANCPGYTDLADAYCGCIEGKCAWFTQPETLVLRAEAQVTGWQGDIPQHHPPEPKTANEMFERWLSEDLMLRQMRRLAGEEPLPRKIEFSFTWHPKSKVTALVARADGKPAPAWLVAALTHLRMPSPNVRPFRPVKVEGTLHVERDPGGN